MALTADAKDQARESHAREITGRQIRPKSLEEDFPDYQKLLDIAEIEPTPPLPGQTTPLPRHPLPYRGKNEGGEWLDGDEADDTGTSGGVAQNPVHSEG
jgi:hypothetical protein